MVPWTIASVTTAQLRHWSSKEVVDKYVNRWMWLCSVKTIFIKSGGGQDLASGPQFAVSSLSILKKVIDFHLRRHVTNNEKNGVGNSRSFSNTGIEYLSFKKNTHDIDIN